MKPKILFINSVCGFGSTGRIVADLASNKDFETLVCFGRKKDYANINSYKFANFFDNAFGALRTILFDNNLNICSAATKRLIKKIKEFNPDIIHLHNIHGYYLNVEMLFKFLKEYNKPVVWTLHDCWPVTGYCPTADYVHCKKYEKGCENCPLGFAYPFSLFKQKLKKDYLKKKELFNSLNNLYLITPSKWMKSIIDSSFLNEQNIQVINNGIRLDSFHPTIKKNDKFTVLAVASMWTYDRGKEELQKIIDLLDKDIECIVVGTWSEKFKNCTTIKHTNNVEELVDLYSKSHALLNPTLDENFPTVNMESLACGTPVITYRTGGSPEIIDEKTGYVIEKGDYKAMAEYVNKLKNNYTYDSKDCVDRSKLFSIDNMKNGYEGLYNTILKKL